MFGASPQSISVPLLINIKIGEVTEGFDLVKAIEARGSNSGKVNGVVAIAASGVV